MYKFNSLYPSYRFDVNKTRPRGKKRQYRIEIIPSFPTSHQKLEVRTAADSEFSADRSVIPV